MPFNQEDVQSLLSEYVSQAIVENSEQERSALAERMSPVDREILRIARQVNTPRSRREANPSTRTTMEGSSFPDVAADSMRVFARGGLGSGHQYTRPTGTLWEDSYDTAPREITSREPVGMYQHRVTGETRYRVYRADNQDTLDFNTEEYDQYINRTVTPRPNRTASAGRLGGSANYYSQSPYRYGDWQSLNRTQYQPLRATVTQAGLPLGPSPLPAHTFKAGDIVRIIKVGNPLLFDKLCEVVTSTSDRSYVCVKEIFPSGELEGLELGFYPQDLKLVEAANVSS